jgi:hypothetical protein
MQGLTNINLSERYPMADADSSGPQQSALSKTTPRMYRRWLKRYQVLSHYSGGGDPRCDCCDETRLEFLAIDHVHGGGNKHRAAIGTNVRMHDWLLQQGLPDGYRVLCHNCNLSHGYYGYCPHQSGERLRAAMTELHANPPRSGERHHMARLTTTEVLEIRARAAAGESYMELARAYGRCKATISHVVKRRQWKHV